MSQEYYSVLARTITSVAQDHAQLRGIVYRLARVELQRELRRRYKAEMQEQKAALEDAIALIEADFDGNNPPLQLERQPSPNSVNEQKSTHNVTVMSRAARKGSADGDDNTVEVFTPVAYPPLYEERRWFQSKAHASELPPAEQAHFRTWWKLQFVVAAFVGVAIYILGETQNVHNLIARHAHMGTVTADISNNQPNSATSTNAASVPQTLDGAPLPTSYGVFAISNAKLVELGTLPIRVPDPRVAISAMISSPSETTLPNGHVNFVVFRRDLLNDAPDRVMVRVVAKVMRALTFARGKADLVKIDGEWAVRGNSYEMKVSPIAGRPEMILIEPVNGDFSFPAGRYALVLKRVAYDFTVGGPIIDPAQCLERTDAVGAAVYSECRKP
jgi:hypothetical protein